MSEVTKHERNEVAKHERSEVDERAAKITHKLLVNSSDEGTCWWREHLDLLPDVQAIVEIMLRLREAVKQIEHSCCCPLCEEVGMACLAHDKLVKQYE